MGLQVNQRVLKLAKQNALLQANRIRKDVGRRDIVSWGDIERRHGVAIPPYYKEKEFTYPTFSEWLMIWENSFESRLEKAVETPAKEILRIDKNVETFGALTLKPEQQSVYFAIYDWFFTKNKRAAYQDGLMGSGKTPTTLAIIAKAIKEGKVEPWRLHPFIILCPKILAEHWRRECEKMGLYKYVESGIILIIPKPDLTCAAGETYAHEEEDPYTGETRYVWEPMATPLLLVIDEAHEYINPEAICTKKVIACFQSKFFRHALFLSATPMEKVNDAYTFCMAARTTFMDMEVNENTFKQFAGLLDQTPERPNREAVKRLRQVLTNYFFSFPYVKPKYKAINVVQMVEFASDQDRIIYKTAYERYVEALRKSGQNTEWGRFQAFIALGVFIRTVERLRAWYLVERAVENYKSQTYATVIGTRYKETIAECVFNLVDKHGIDRDKISVVWGGRRQYKSDELLGKDQLQEVLERLRKGEIAELMNDDTLMKRVKLTIKYIQDGYEHTETEEQQAHRHNRLRELKLVGKQSDDARQGEIDKFQSGHSQILLFTLASGKLGLSFDRDKELLLPREGLFTPCYSGKEFQQVLGRLVRRMSISDAVQRICMMKGTVEEFHVAPILDEKLKCIAEITNRNFDVIDLLSQELPTATPSMKVRDVAQAAKDAEHDDTIVSDFHSDNEEDDE